MSKSTGQQYVIDELTKLAGLLQSGNSSIANADKVFKDVQTAKPEDRPARPRVFRKSKIRNPINHKASALK